MFKSSLTGEMPVQAQGDITAQRLTWQVLVVSVFPGKLISDVGKGVRE